MKKNLDKVIYYLIISVIIGLPFFKFTAYNLYLTHVIEDSFDFNHVVFLWILLIPLIITYIYGIVSKKFKINYIDYIFYILIICGLISTIVASNINIAIVGEIDRNEGILSLLAYYFIALCIKNLNNKEYIKKIINIILIVGLFLVGYAIIQVYTNVGFVKHFSVPYIASSLCGNPNFFGSYLVMLLCISINEFLLNKEYKYLIFSIIYFIGLVLAGSTGPFITFIIMTIFIIIKNFKRTKIKYILLLLIFIPTLFISNYFIKIVHNNIDQSYNIVDDISNIKDKNINQMTSGRLDLWKRSIPLVKKYYLLGAGIDNFGIVFEKVTKDIRFDKAHNVYLQILITNGIVPLLLVLALCFITFIKGFKIIDTMYLSIYFACIGYMIQAFSNISVIDVAPIFFVLLGLILNKDIKKSI